MSRQTLWALLVGRPVRAIPAQGIQMLTHLASLVPSLVPEGKSLGHRVNRGIEPSFSSSQPDVLPLNHTHHGRVAGALTRSSGPNDRCASIHHHPLNDGVLLELQDFS